MAFEERRFLGISPRALLLGLVATGVVVGLFFIPETVKYLFDPKAKPLKDRLAITTKSNAPARKTNTSSSGKNAEIAGGRAALAPEALKALNGDMQGGKDTDLKKNAPVVRGAKRPADNADEPKERGGLFSGWNFNVRARESGNVPRGVPEGLTFERLGTKDAAAFFSSSQSSLAKFIKAESSQMPGAVDAVAPFMREVASIGSGALLKSERIDDAAGRLRSAHITALKGLKSAGADRGILMRWLQLPAVQFVDQQGGLNMARRLKSVFSPSVVLSDLTVRQARRVRWSGDGRIPTKANFELSVSGSDVARLMLYCNGKLVRTLSNVARNQNQRRPFRFGGDAYGVWTVVAHDTFGAKPFSKSYSFYPRASVFRQSRNGEYEISFLPGSAANSLDKFFAIGETARGAARDGMISRF